ncbi:MAG: acetate/propionate family kinase [Chlamydiia bacterium]|nr:acetate/propionate family kinase [Chlamydiia bacterium]
MHLLVINTGSSSLKSALFSLTGGIESFRPPLWRKHIEWKGDIKKFVPKSFKEMFRSLWKIVASKEIDYIGHRVVHGGQSFVEPTLITSEIKNEIEHLISLAPLHNSTNLEGILAAEHFFPESQQFAVFDTAFHSTLGKETKIYPGPYEWESQGIIRYGFHGISHQYTSSRAVTILGKPIEKLCVCHLGAGASLCAIKNGKSVDTTMGFTPMEGVMMGSRSGTIDPGIIIYLGQKGYSLPRINEILNNESGLLGLSGISEDMREIIVEAAKNHPRALLALNIYLHRLCQGILQMMVSLEGLNALVFTGGIGENCSYIREKVAEKLKFLGVELDQKLHEKNQDKDRVITSSQSSIDFLVIHTQEEWQIAKECCKIIQPQKDDIF